MVKFTLRTKLFLSFAVVLTLMGMMAGIIINQLRTVTQITQTGYTHGFTGVKLLGDAISEAQHVKERLLLLHSAPDTLEQLRQQEQMVNHANRMVELLNAYKTLINTEGAQAAIADFEDAWAEYIETSAKVVQLNFEGDTKNATILLRGDAESELESALNYLLLAQDIEDNIHRAEYIESQRIIQTAPSIALGISAVAVLIGLWISIWLSQTIASPMAKIAEAAQRAIGGDLGHTISIGAAGNDEIGILSRAFNSMSVQMRDLVSSLEQRVEERTAELENAGQQVQHRAEQFEAIAQVSRVINSIQSHEDLLRRVTRMISQYFGFYHVGIFLLDDNKKFATLRATNSEGGRNMLKRGHRLEIGRTGIVGYVTSTGNPRIALDTGADAVYFDNPDLPETRSEMALPLKAGGQVIGALDVQSTQENAFAQEDINILSTLADQVSAALENARLHEEAREAVVRAEKASKQMTGESWANIQRLTPVRGYRFDGNKAQPLSRSTNGGQAESLADAYSIPVRLRGESIGHLTIKSASDGHQWTEDEIAVIQATAERVALAAENARLVAESQKRASKEQVIGEVSSKISSAINVDNILQTALREMGRILPGAEISIQVENE